MTITTIPEEAVALFDELERAIREEFPDTIVEITNNGHGGGDIWIAVVRGLFESVEEVQKNPRIRHLVSRILEETEVAVSVTPVH